MKPSLKTLLAFIPAALVVSAALAAPPEALVAAAQGHRTTIKHQGKEVRETTPEGGVHTERTSRLEIEGLGARELHGVIDDQPASLGGQQKATITDGDQTTVFSYDPGTNAITIEAGGGSTTIVQNPDHTYSVDGAAAADGSAAVSMLAEKSAWQSASPHSVMLAYSYAHMPNMAIKGGTQEAGTAESPAVCSLFEDFCEAAACAKAGGCEE